MQSDEVRPLDSSGDPKATNVAQETIKALSIGVQARTRGMDRSAATASRR